MRFIKLLAAVPAIFVANVAFADQQGGYYGHPMWGSGWHGWFMGPFMMMLFLVVAVALVVFFVRKTGDGRTTNDPSRKSPLDILKERFARGEIDQTEYEERRKVLED